jgi:hypothetical protein
MMTDNDDKDYFRLRAEDEIARAQQAVHPDAVRSHYLLAGFYLDRAHRENAQARSQH